MSISLSVNLPEKQRKFDFLHTAYNRGLLTWDELWMCRDEVSKEGTGRITQREIIKRLAEKIGEKYAIHINGIFLETIVKNKLDNNEDLETIKLMGKKRRKEFEDSIRKSRQNYRFNKLF